MLSAFGATGIYTQRHGASGKQAMASTKVLPSRPMQAARRLRAVPAVAAPTQGSAATAAVAAPAQDTTAGALKQLHVRSQRGSRDKGKAALHKEVAELCQQATIRLQQDGSALPAREFSFLGASIVQAIATLSGTTHATVIGPLAEATIAAALQAPAMATASLNAWSDLLYGLARAGVHNQGLTDLMARAQHTITTSGGFATATGRTCGDMAWTLGRLGYSVDQPDTAAVLTQLVQAVNTGDAMATARVVTWSQLITGLVRCGCSVDTGNPASTVVNVRPVAVAAVATLQAATFKGSDSLHASNTLLALANLGCKATPGSQPDISPLVASIVQHVQADRRLKEVPQVTANLLTALVKSGADKATAQPALDQLVPLFTSKVQGGQCSGEQLSHVVDALAHYGVEPDKEVLMKGMATPAPSAAE